jgi:hypothetical protein
VTRTGSGGFNTAIRIPAPLLERIDAFARQLQSELPGSEVTRSEAIRILVTRALDSVNPPGPPMPTPPASGAKT